MTQRTLHAHLSHEAAAYLDGDNNAAGQTLRDWLLNAFEQQSEPCLAHASLFSTSIEVAPDVPLLLEAYVRILGCTPDETIEAWLMEPATEASANIASDAAAVGNPPAVAPTLSGETLGRFAQILDMGETLFETFTADARQKLGGSYPEGEKAAQTMTAIFRALRVTVGLQQPTDQPATQNGESQQNLQAQRSSPKVDGAVDERP
jgi:hypothetical protein